METCFALMGCKNVVCDTVTPTPKQMRSARRHRERPPSAYRVLRLTKIVKTAAVCADGEDGLTDEDMTTEERAGVGVGLRRGPIECSRQVQTMWVVQVDGNDLAKFQELPGCCRRDKR